MTDEEIGGPGSEVAVVPKDVEDAHGLVKLALEQGVSVEVLERLVALQERVSDRNARAEYFEALARFQDEAPEILKSRSAKIATRSGSDYSYTYAPLEAITRAIGVPLRSNGFSYAWTTEGIDGDVLNVVCVLRHVGGHEERAAFPVSTKTSAAMSEAQKHGAALTYGKRQSLTSVLGLTTADDDTDGVDPKKESDAATESQIADMEAVIEEVGKDRAKILMWTRSWVDLPGEGFMGISVDDLAKVIKALRRKVEGDNK